MGATGVNSNRDDVKYNSLVITAKLEARPSNMLQLTIRETILYDQ